MASKKVARALVCVCVVVVEKSSVYDTTITDELNNINQSNRDNTQTFTHARACTHRSKGKSNKLAQKEIWGSVKGNLSKSNQLRISWTMLTRSTYHLWISVKCTSYLQIFVKCLSYLLFSLHKYLFDKIPLVFI